MFRGNMIRWTWAVAVGVMVVSGCECPGPNPPVNCTDTTITFETPAADQTVDAPFDVSIIVKNADGSAFNFERAELKVSGGDAIQATSVSGNRATFTGVPSGAGAQSLVATISQNSCSKSSQPHNITVRDACSNAQVTAVSFPQDTGAPLGVLNASELPSGTGLQVQVDAQCVTGVQVRLKRGTTEVSPLTAFSNGRATISLPGIADSELVEVFAELVRGATPVNTLASNPQAGASIQVSRALPSCAVTTTGTFGPNDDADSSTPGFQMRVTGTMAPNTSGTLAVVGQMPVSVVSVGGVVSADFTLSGSGIYDVTLTCTDGSGNTNTATGAFMLDFVPPTVSIVSPTVVDGGATTTVTQSPLQVQVSTDAENGSMVQVTRNGTPVGSVGTVMNGMATVQVPFSADGTFTIGVTVTDGSGNSTTVTFVVNVALSGCGADFSRPATCPAFLTPAQMPGGMYSFQTTSRTLCANQPASLFRADLLADGGMTMESPAGTATVAATGLAQFPPLTLTSGDYVFRATVANTGVDAGLSVVTCQVTVDLDGPVITSPVVPTGGTAAVLNAAQDTQPGTPGVQRLLSFSARVPVGGRVDVCTTQGVDPVTMAARPTSPECGTGWYALRQGVNSPESGFTYPEGTYDLKIVVVGSGLPVAPASASVPLVVDSVRPCVTALSRRLPQDTNMDGRLNIAELNGAAPQLEFSLGCGDVSAATLAAMNPVVVRDITAGALGAVRPSTATISGSTYTVTLTGPYTTEVDLEVMVQLTDAAGNSNQLAAMNDPATFVLRVDPVAPSCDIQSPGAGQTLVGQAGVTGGMFPVIVGTGMDVPMNGVRVTFGTVAARDITPTNGTAQTSYAVTGTSTVAIGATCRDASGNATTATARNITIDLDAPTCSITAPTAMTYSANQIATSITVGGAEGQPVTVRTTLQTPPLTTSLVVTGGVASGPLSYPNGSQTVTAEVRDAAGNQCTATANNVLVNSTSCALALTNAVFTSSGAWFNRNNTGSLGATTGVIASVNANSADCRSGQTVTLVRTAPTAGTPVNSTTATNGDVSFANVSVNDGETWTVTINNGTGVLTTQTFRVGLRVPTAGGATINLQPLTTGQPLFFVAPSGNINLEPSAGTPKATTYFSDAAQGTPGAQVNVAVSAVNGTRYGTDNGLVEVRYGSTVLASQSVTSEPFTFPTTGITLAHNTADTFVIRLTSAAGNTVDIISNAATVDVIAPAEPTVTRNLTAVRAATVTLGWNPVYDDGSDSSSGGLIGGPATQLAGYDVRWTTSSVTANNNMAAISDFFGSAAQADGITAWSAAAISRPLQVPPINTYYVAVRARDEVGNYSAFTPPAAVNNPWVTSVITAPVASTSFGASLLTAPLIGNDTAADLVVTATGRGGVGSVYVYNSSLLAASVSGCPAGCQELVPSDLVAGAFGSDLSIGNVGAVGSEARADLVIAQTHSATPFAGRVVLFFGTTATTLSAADSIEFRGDINNRIGQTASVIKDITGDGRDEIAIAAPLFSSNRGRIFIYRGRDRADWLTIRTGVDATTSVPFIPVGTTTADYVIDGPSPVLATPAGNAFGQNRRGLISVNDLDGDTFPDVALPTSRGSINRYRVFGSAVIKTSTGASPLDSTAGFRLEISETPIADNSSLAGVGMAALGNADFFSSSPAADLIISYPGLGGGGQLLLFSALAAPSSPTLNPPVTQRISGPLTFGSSLAAAPVDADATTDILAATSLISGNAAYLLYQRSSQFEMGGVGNYFWVTRFDGTLISGNPNSRLGSATVLSDVNGDAQIDVILGDSQIGEVRVWR